MICQREEYCVDSFDNAEIVHSSIEFEWMDMSETTAPNGNQL